MSTVTVYTCPHCGEDFISLAECRAHIRECERTTKEPTDE